MKRFLFLFSFLFGCSQDTHFYSASFTSPEGRELTEESCTPDLMRFFELAIEHFKLSAEMNGLPAKKMYPKDRVKSERLRKKIVRLIGEYRMLSREKDLGELIAITEESIRAYKSFLRLPRGNTNFKDHGIQLFAEVHDLSMEHIILTVERAQQISESYRFSLDLCRLFESGWEITEAGTVRASEINRLKTEAKLLNDESYLLFDEQERLQLNSMTNDSTGIRNARRLKDILQERVHLLTDELVLIRQRRDIEDHFISGYNTD